MLLMIVTWAMVLEKSLAISTEDSNVKSCLRYMCLFEVDNLSMY